MTYSFAPHSAMSEHVELLADHPHFIAAVGALRWREWGRAPEPEQLDWWADVTRREAGRITLPITWVAITAQGEVAGAVGLGEFDIADRRDRSPWVLGLVVAEQHRGTGIGGRLMAALEAWAPRQGYATVWVATGGCAVAFYQKYGWEVAEIVALESGECTTVLRKSL
jgi:GNAT superfamily N-acetyltransferase